MVQQIVNAVVPVAVAALIAVLVAIIGAVGDAAVSFIRKKKEALQVKIGADTYNKNLSFAFTAWNIVEEFFRITPAVEKTLDSTGKMFADEMKKFVPSLTDAEIEQLRQAVSGAVNKGKAVVVAPAVQPISIPTETVILPEATAAVADIQPSADPTPAQ